MGRSYRGQRTPFLADADSDRRQGLAGTTSIVPFIPYW